MEKALSEAHNDHHDKSGETYSHSSRSTNPAEGHTRTSHDTNALTVDWDGPDDPENPRK
jgi:hypothetical protein